MASPRLVFVMSPHQNAFFGEIVDVLVEALGSIGVTALTTTEAGDHEVADDDVFVLTPPHEYVALEGSSFVDDPVVAGRTIGLSAEQPSEVHFASNARVGSKLGAVLDFSPLAVEAYRRHGVSALHLPFGYTPAWDRTDQGRRVSTVSTAALYLGNNRTRRLAILAGAADELVDVGARLVVSDPGEPNRATSPSFVAGEDKRQLLASTGLLVNVHQSEMPYFEWLRFAEAVHCGTPVLTERSELSAPFVDGEHFESFDEDRPGRRLGDRLRELVDRRDELDAMAARAYATLRERPLHECVGILVEAAERCSSRRAPVSLPARTRSAPIGRARIDPPVTSSWTPPRASRRLGALFGRRHPGGPTLVAPGGTTLVVPVEELIERSDGADLTILMAAGADVDGGPMLEGVWPWEPWRLGHGQHHGRTLIADGRLVPAARRWLDDDAFDEHPYLALQVFAAAHGLRVAHVARPVARLEVPVDAAQSIPAALVDTCRRRLWNCS